MLTTGASETTRGCGMGKVKRGKGKAAKTPKKLTRADEWINAAAVTDPGTYEHWTKKLTVERLDEADQVRRQTFDMLTLNDRVIVEGGRVTQKGAKNRFEHACLDPLLEAGILDDPLDPTRAEQRVKGGIELLNMGIIGNVFPRSTAAWRDVNGGSGGGPPISEEDAEKFSARCEMRYLRGADVVGAADWEMVRAVIVDAVVPPGTKRRRLCNALDLIAEFYLDVTPPKDVVRPRVPVRDRTPPAWLGKRGN